MKDVCVCENELRIHFSVQDILKLILDYAHQLSSKFFEESLYTSKYFVSTNYEGWEILGKRYGLFVGEDDPYPWRDFSSAELPIMRLSFWCHEIHLQIEFSKTGSCYTSAGFESADWFSSLFASRLSLREAMHDALIYKPSPTLKQRFERVYDLMLREICKFVDETLKSSKEIMICQYAHTFELERYFCLFFKKHIISLILEFDVTFDFLIISSRFCSKQ
jgi:hypothetical protein